MKKNFFYAMMSAIALTSAVSFTGCASDDGATVENNPTYDGTSVRTDFAFNVTKASQGTRMSAENVQEESNPFLGMKEMYLLPFKGVPAASNKTTNYSSNEVKNYYLGDLESASIATNQSSKVYSLTIPVGTDNFLFYGTADNAGTYIQKGAVTSSLANTVGNIDDINFNLTSIQSSLGSDATNLAAYLNAIIATSYSTSGETPVTTTWKSTTTTANTDGNYSAIALLYTKFIKNLDQYAGSTEGVQRLVFDLYKSAYAINAQSPDVTVQNVAKEICKNIENTSGTVKLTIKASSATEAAAISINSATDVSKAEEWVATLTGVNEKFPANLSLPMGAAQLYWTAGTTDYVSYELNPNVGGGSVTTSMMLPTALSDYRYPAELIYFDNSPLRATEQYRRADQYPVTAATWDETGSMTDNSGFNTTIWNKDEVTPATRAVAMQNNVNYGVSMLVTNVKLTSAAMTDNMKGLYPGAEANQTITAATTRNDATKNSVFKVTGILVGGQPNQVGWNMVPTAISTFNSVIYDNDVTFSDIPLSSTGTGKNNYTLVFDNYVNGTQLDVNIALEIVNDGCDFYGAEGLIPAGSTFYLLGKLELSSNAQNWNSGDGKLQATRKASYRITNEETKRVFVQDYKTTANITLAANALSKAYSAIPDLRATEVLFGLSVDLKWETGLTFNVNM